MNKAFSKIKLSLRHMKVFENAYYWFIAPLAIIFIALICGSVYSTVGNQYDGFANVGIDFKAGTVLTVELDSVRIADYDASLKIIKEVVEANGAKISVAQKSGTTAIVVRYTNSINGLDYSSAEKSEEMILINRKIQKSIETKFVETYGQDTVVSADAEMTNATASSELIKKAFLAVGIAMLLMLVYIVIRFDLFSGLAAICGQFHDILIMLSLVIIFRIQINSSLIAGIITIVAYAINNTIVVFDRVRENMVPYKSQKLSIDPRFIINKSVSESITRSIFTSLTTLITITILACFGVQSLTEFALPIIFGIIAGFYSSTFLAPSIWGLMMQVKINGVRKSRKAKASK